MAITELANSRTITYNNGNPIGIREYYAHPYATEKGVIDEYLSGNLPQKMTPWPSTGYFTPPVSLYVQDFSIRRDPNVPEAWYVTITYRERGDAALTPALTPNDVGYMTMRLSVEARFQDVWRQWWSDEETNAQAGRGKLDEFARPIYSVGTQDSDIGGRKVDVAGQPTSVMRHMQRMQLELVTGAFPSAAAYRAYLGVRNLTVFLGAPAGTLVFTGADAAMVSPGKWQVTFAFDVDYFFHLQQVAKRNLNGSILLDGETGGSVQGTGHAKVVSWVQPFPIVKEMRGLNSYFVSLP